MNDNTAAPTGADMKKDQADQDYAAVLLRHDKGRLHADASRALQEVVAAVALLGKKGSLTVKLDVEPLEAGAVRLRGTVTPKAPIDPAASIWYANEEGELTVNNPNQPSMFDGLPGQ